MEAKKPPTDKEIEAAIRSAFLFPETVNEVEAREQKLAEDNEIVMPVVYDKMWEKIQKKMEAKTKNCPICEGSGFTPYANRVDAICGNCKGTGSVEAKPIKKRLDYDNGAWITFEEDHGFVIQDCNDSIYLSFENAVKVMRFIADNNQIPNVVAVIKTIKD